MDNRTVGQNIAKLRKLKDFKASEMAMRLSMKESTYTKYERGETAITLAFLNKVATILSIDALKILTASPNSLFETSFNSSENSSHVWGSVKQNTEMSVLIEGIISLNEKLALIIGNKQTMI